MRKKISTWILDNQTKALIILFSVIFILAALLPEGSGDDSGQTGDGGGRGVEVAMPEKKNHKTECRDSLTDSIKNVF